MIPPTEGHVRGMAVLPEWRGHGVADQLLETVDSEFRSRECSRISLDTTEPLLLVIRFCEKRGFRRSGKIGGFWGMPLIEFIRNLS
jgi:GNAT superfamily N-acetyltransferase